MKKLKKGICLILTVLLCAGLFAACGNENEEPIQGELLGGRDSLAVVVEFEDSRPLLWEEFFFDLHRCRLILESQGLAEDWDAIFEEQTFFPGEVTFNEFAILYAMDTARERRAVEALFNELGETLEDNFYEDLRELVLTQQEFDEESFQAFLAEHFVTEAVFRYINELPAMRERAMAALFGEEGELVPQEAIDAFIAEEGIVRAKHILLSTRDDQQQELPEEEVAAAAALAEELYEELRTLSEEELFERFDEMVAEYGGDPGMRRDPTGYTFGPGVMVPEFTAGTQALELFAFSEPIESFHGFHIILRMPVERDAVPMLAHGTGAHTIQALVAWSQIEHALAESKEGLVYETTSLFDQIIPSQVFANSVIDTE